MRIPTVHINGDCKSTLEADNTAAYEAINKAIEAVQAAGPNGRNFYPQGDGVINEAISEHRRRLETLGAILQEFETIICGISEQ